MTYPTIWDLVLFAAFAVIALWARYGLPAYLAEKGKNLASKQDLEELTRKVEGVKAEYLGELERLRFDLGRAALVHKAQFETEFRVYEEIWKCLIDVQRTVMALRPMLDYTDPKESNEKRRDRHLREFSDAFNAMQTAVWKNKPFYADTVHRELQELSLLIQEEAIEYQHGDPIRDEHYWRGMRKNIEGISNKINAVCEAIRQRVSTGDSA